MILAPADIGDKLEELIHGLFPGETTYRELVESDFDRPSNLIVQEECKGIVGYGCNNVELQPVFTVTTYVPVDEYHNSHLNALHERQMRLLGLLMPGYIRVKDRAAKVIGVDLGGGYDFDTVTVKFSYVLDRNDFIEIEQRPLMQTLHTNEEVTTHG